MNDHEGKTTAPPPERIAYLVAGFIKKTLTPSEHDELDAWVEASDENMLLFENMTDETQLQKDLAWMGSIDTASELNRVKGQLQFNEPKQNKRSKKLWMYGIAATLLFAVAAFYIIKQWSDSNNSKEQGFSGTIEEIMPATASVTLTLSNGKQMALSEMGNQQTITDSGALLVTDAGVLQYNNTLRNETSLMNTLATGPGSTYHVVLSDGTKAWLNAGSSLTYPVQFGKGGRTVQLTGEGYFDVAKTGSPFSVRIAGKTSVLVKGTQFNVKHYNDETEKQVTLIEGSVQVLHENKTSMLSPGQLADLSTGNIKVAAADINEVTGWRKDLFVFRDATVEQIMQAVKRWYNIEVVYEVKSQQLFNATISKREPLSKLLHLLQLTGKVKFIIKNNKVYVQ